MTDSPFELLRLIGKGGMGEVWLARDLTTGERVAVKLLHPMYASEPEHVARFEREVETAQRVRSPHVVRVLGYGRHEGRPYISMEYVEGRSLREIVKQEGPLPWSRVRQIALDLCEALAAVHGSGVIHRDVKPSNVLVTSDGTLKLTDFGVARAADLTRMTSADTMLGTVQYMPPEGDGSVRGDLYSLGCLLYELLAGAAPFEGDSHPAVLMRHIRDAPNLDVLPPEARVPLGWLLEKSPAMRPQSAREFAGALRGGTYSHPAPSGDSGRGAVGHVGVTSERASRGRSRGMLVMLWTLAALVVGLGAVVGLVAWLGNDDAEADAGAWAMVPDQVVAYEPPAGLTQVRMTVGPFVWGADVLVVSFTARPQCAPGETELNWYPDVGTNNVMLRTTDGGQVLSSSGWGLGTATARLKCDTDYVGTWTFPVGDAIPATLVYASPEFSLVIPTNSGHGLSRLITLAIPEQYAAGQSVTVAALRCLATLSAPAHGAPPGECFAPRERLTIVSGPVDNLLRWWEVEAPDGKRGWVEQSQAVAALEK